MLGFLSLVQQGERIVCYTMSIVGFSVENTLALLKHILYLLIPSSSCLKFKIAHFVLN